MGGEITTASLRDLLRFPFRREEWPSRFLLGSLLIFIGFWVPVLPWIPVCGYLLRVMRRVVEGEEPTLLSWDDWPDLTTDGLRALVVELAWLLPGGLVLGGGVLSYLFVSLVFPVLEKGGVSEGLIALFLFLAMGVFLFSLFVGTVLFILGLIPMPIGLAHLAATGELSAAFRVKEWWGRVRSDPLGYLTVWIVLLGLGGLVYLGVMLLYYSGCLCCLTPFLSAPALLYLGLVGAALFGQFYREYTAL